ncbi:MJ0042-type zinc finger domain-containing protein [Hwanghaeella sp. LZ110]|uniref:MJ0042-type zinc finger domain-containing protein n=1 Tax=Hwanghaeella sp. LZ110 TaxID=3402810 RepID=UPI003B66EBC3
MILTCPNCSTKFRVKDDAIGPTGRKVKCRNCANVWHAMPEGMEEPAPAPSSTPPSSQRPAPTPVEQPEFVAPADRMEEDFAPPPAAAAPLRSPAPNSMSANDMNSPPDGMDPPPIAPDGDFVLRQRQPKVEKKSPVMAWVILLILLIATGAVGFFFRDGIVAAYPPIARVYSWVGLDANLLINGLIPEADDAKAIQTEDGIRLVFTGKITSKLSERVDIPLLRGSLVDTNQQELHVWTFTADKPDILPGETVSFTTEVVNPPPGVTNANFTLLPNTESAIDDGPTGMNADDPSKTMDSESHGTDSHSTETNSN